VATRKQTFIWIVGCAVAVLALRLGCKYGYADGGTAPSVGELQSAFRRSGTRIASTWTNNCIAQFPFTGSVSWNLRMFRGTSLKLMGTVSTNGLERYVAACRGVDFIFAGKSFDGRNVTKGADGLLGYETRTGGGDEPALDLITWHTLGFIAEQDTARGWTIIHGSIDLTNQTGHLTIYEDEYRSR